MPLVPCSSIYVCKGRGGHAARKASDHLIDQRLAVAARENLQLVMRLLTERLNALERLSCLVLHIPKCRNVPVHLDNGIYTHASDRLNEQRKLTRTPYVLVVGEQRFRIVFACWGQ